MIGKFIYNNEGDSPQAFTAFDYQYRPTMGLIQKGGTWAHTLVACDRAATKMAPVRAAAVAAVNAAQTALTAAMQKLGRSERDVGAMRLEVTNDAERPPPQQRRRTARAGAGVHRRNNVGRPSNEPARDVGNGLSTLVQRAEALRALGRFVDGSSLAS